MHNTNDDQSKGAGYPDREQAESELRGLLEEAYSRMTRFEETLELVRGWANDTEAEGATAATKQAIALEWAKRNYGIALDLNPETQADPEFVRLEQQRADVARWAAAEAESDPEQGHADAAAQGFTPGEPSLGITAEQCREAAASARRRGSEDIAREWDLLAAERTTTEPKRLMITLYVNNDGDASTLLAILPWVKNGQLGLGGGDATITAIPSLDWDQTYDSADEEGE